MFVPVGGARRACLELTEEIVSQVLKSVGELSDIVEGKEKGNEVEER
jgi:hypothetical protein